MPGVPPPSPGAAPRQVRIGGAALIGCMSSAVHCYGGKTGGARQYSLPQPAPIQCMQLLAAHTARPVKALLVALANGEPRFPVALDACWPLAVRAWPPPPATPQALQGRLPAVPDSSCYPPRPATHTHLDTGEVRVYHERSLVYTHTCAAGGAATALAFGRYAREDNTLVAVTRSGGLDIKARRGARQAGAVAGDAGKRGRCGAAGSSSSSNQWLPVVPQQRWRTAAHTAHAVCRQAPCPWLRTPHPPAASPCVCPRLAPVS